MDNASTQDTRFNLQRFADGDAGASADTTAPKVDADSSASSKQDAGKESTADKEADVQRRIDDALAAAKDKWQKEYDAKVKRDRAEAERLAKLSEDERRKVELDNRQKELDAREQELHDKDLKLELVGVLSKRGIPVEFADYLMDEDSTKTLARVTTFEKAFKKAVEAGVNERLKGKAPKIGGNINQASTVSHVRNGFFDAIYKNQAKR